MNSAKQVDLMVADWKSQGLTKTEIIIRTAEACMGWPYVWGATGQQCTPAYRKTYAARSSCPDGEKTEILSQCQVTREKNPASSCAGCVWYPNNERVLIDDCQGFIKQTAKRVGITFTGGGCTSMWNDRDNWSEQGDIKDLPERLCCVFWTDSKNPKVKSHIGWYIGNGWMIHCSGKVKKEKLSAKCTNYAVPKGLDETIPDKKPTLRKGSKGEYVTLLQTKLIQLGYDVGSSGADGKFGNKTASALTRFQNDHGLTPDAVCGNASWEALLEGKTQTYTVTISHVSKSVADGIIKTYGGTMTAEGT